jgi:hypothetical protein
MTGLMMIIESVLLLRAVILFQIYSVVSMGHARQARISRPARIDIRSMMIASGFLCLLIGGLVFVALPRNIGSQAFGQWGNQRSVSGFADEVELGRPGLISMSSKPVLDLTVLDRDGNNIGSESYPPIYLRGAVLEVYDSGNWRRSSIMRVPFAERVRLFPANTTLKPRGLIPANTRWDQQFEITMRSTSDGPVSLFAPWRPIEFRLGDQPMRMGFDFRRGLFMKDGIGGSFTYTVSSVNDEFRPRTQESGQERSELVPTQIDPEIRRLASEIVSNGGVDPDPARRPISEDISAVRLIETHLRTQYKYTLDAQPVPSGVDATRWFLFERRMGHCEYYASALTLMSRSVGVPARVVTGYIASDFNPVTGQYLVRESNAHAWVEAEISPGQWRTFDGTPPSDFHSIHVPEPGLFRTLSKMYESVEMLWVRTVVGYDATTREQIIGSRSGNLGLARFGDRLLSRIAAGRAELVTRAGVVAIIVFSCSMFLGVVLLRYQRIVLGLLALWRSFLTRLGLGLRHRVSPHGATDRMEYAIEGALRRVGLVRPDWQPLKSYLSDHRNELEQMPELGEALDGAADWIYRSRFAASPNHDGSEQLRGLRDAMRRSEKRHRTRSPNSRGTSPTP